MKKYNAHTEFKALLGLPMQMVPNPRGIALAFFLFLSLTLSSGIAMPVQAATVSDPLQPINRTTHEFNSVVDTLLVKPLALSYQKLVPRPVKTGVRNFFGNLNDVRVTFNDLLQLKFGQAAQDLGRFAINSTLGVGGLMDVADPAFGLEKNRQDFGMTLAHYGVESGPYVVLPLLGPSTVRDAFGLTVDTVFHASQQIGHVATRNSLRGAEAVDFRESVLSFDDLIIGDEYLFIRGAYLQQREFAIDGDFMDVAFEDF